MLLPYRDVLWTHICVVALLVYLCGEVRAATPVQFNVNGKLSQGFALPRVWEAVGSGHAALGFRQDWREQLKNAALHLGMRFVRFHGVLDDDMGPVVLCEHDVVDPLWSDEPPRAPVQCTYNWTGVDSVYDFVVSLGMRPYVELSFMPSALASANHTYLAYGANVTPPRNFSAWGDMVSAFVEHLVSRYGLSEVRTWWFECWNEPNLSRNIFGAFWEGTQDQYFTLYQHTALAVKAVDASLRVGGPASAGGGWLTDFVSFVANHSLPLDFISTHHYPALHSDNETQEATSMFRDVQNDNQTMKEIEALLGRPLPYILSEYNSGLYGFLGGYWNHDLPYAAAFVFQQVTRLITARLLSGDELMSYWAFSDVFDEILFNPMPFHNGYGLQTVQGVPKPAFRAFELLHMLPQDATVLQVARQEQQEQQKQQWQWQKDTDYGDEVTVFAVGNNSACMVLLSNFYAYNQTTTRVGSSGDVRAAAHRPGYRRPPQPPSPPSPPVGDTVSAMASVSPPSGPAYEVRVSIADLPTSLADRVITSTTRSRPQAQAHQHQHSHTASTWTEATVKATLYRIDETHANAFAMWAKQDYPLSLSDQQLAELMTASELHGEALPLTVSASGAVSFATTMDSNSAAAVLIT